MVELARLERVYGRKVIQGSNPCLSAIVKCLISDGVFYYATSGDPNPKGSAQWPRKIERGHMFYLSSHGEARAKGSRAIPVSPLSSD